jgi:hypothetical protein
VLRPRLDHLLGDASAMTKLVEWSLNNKPLLVMLATSGLTVLGACFFLHVRLLRSPSPPVDAGDPAR